MHASLAPLLNPDRDTHALATTMLMTLRPLFLALACTSIGCGGASLASYDLAIVDGLAKIPAATEIESTFGDSDHFITHFGFLSEKSNTWNTEVYFGNAYSLTMQVDVICDARDGLITKVIGEPKFWLLVHSKIEPTDNGGEMASISQQHELTLAQWRQVYAAQGDFSVVGIQLDQSPVPGFAKFVAAVRAPRRQVPR